MRAGRRLRLFIGVFNTLAAAALAAYGTAFPFPFLRSVDLPFQLTASWAAAGAAALATLAIALDLALLGWVALGYLLWAALLAEHALSLVFLALALSLAPVLPRPGGSLVEGLAVAMITAVAVALLRGRLL